MSTGPESLHETIQVPREQMVNTSGSPRCMMAAPSGAQRFVRGAQAIRARIAQGWEVVPCEHRNHIPPGTIETPQEVERKKILSEMMKDDAEAGLYPPAEPKRGRGRPRKAVNNG